MMTLTQRILNMRAHYPTVSAGWIAGELDCHPAYVRAVFARHGLSCPKNPTKTARNSKSPKKLLKSASRLRAKAAALEVEAHALARELESALEDEARALARELESAQ